MEWNKAKEADDLQDWREAFMNADVNGDAHLSHKELTRLFKEHFVIVHERMSHEHQIRFSPAEEHHFEEDAQHFLEHAQKSGDIADLDKMTWQEFSDNMHRAMAERDIQREGLLEVAKHIF